MSELVITVTANLPAESIEHIIAEVTKRVTEATSKTKDELVAIPGKMYTVQETAKILRSSRSTIQKYSNGPFPKLPASKNGGKKLFDGAVIKKFIEDGKS